LRHWNLGFGICLEFPLRDTKTKAGSRPQLISLAGRISDLGFIKEELMGLGDIYLTREGYEKLAKELEHLKAVKRRELSKAIGQARAHGDISENAEYDAAKEAQGLNEKRIAELEDKLARGRILDDENIPKDQVLLGATVTLKDLDTDEEIDYMIVSEEEADYTQGKISATSPVGKALMEQEVNSVVEIKVPAGILRYKILKISR
jgi:transcription elongation factor GreA